MALMMIHTQIDWISGFFPLEYKEEFYNGDFIQRNKHLDIVRQSDIAEIATGSYSSKVRIKPHDFNAEKAIGHSVFISGNLTKFLQGHNILGPSNPQELLVGFFELICKNYGLEKPNIEKILTHGRLTRIDLCRNYQLKSSREVALFIESASTSASMKYRGAGITKPGSLYWKSSNSHGAKMYDKGREIKVHPIDSQIKSPELIAYAQNLLRIEHQIVKRNLETDCLQIPVNWDDNTANTTFDQYLKKITLGNGMNEAKALDQLPDRLKAVYKLWKHGECMKELYPVRTYSRYRKEIKDLTFDDISVTQPMDKTSNVVPLISILEAAPCGIPDFAYDQGLIFQLDKTGSSPG